MLQIYFVKINFNPPFLFKSLTKTKHGFVETWLQSRYVPIQNLPANLGYIFLHVIKKIKTSCNCTRISIHHFRCRYIRSGKVQSTYKGKRKFRVLSVFR